MPTGFGSVMDQEQGIQSSIFKSLGRDNGPHSVAISRILLQQQTWISSNIGMLARGFETLQHPSRFRGFRAWRHPLDRKSKPAPVHGTLAQLIIQHESLLQSIQTLIDRVPAGQRTEWVLREVAHNHREMAWMLTALLKEDATSHPAGTPPGQPAPITKGQEAWENEGGSLVS